LNVAPKREPVIAEAVRTPIGRGHPEKGYYRDVHPSTLLARTFSDLLGRAAIDAVEVGDVITGCVQQIGEQTLNIGRNAWLEAGLPETTAATTLDRQCGSGQDAVNLAALMVAGGINDVAVGCGVEHMGHITFANVAESQERFGHAFTPELLERYGLVPQGLSAEMIAEQWQVSRAELDEIGLRSQRLAQRAAQEGRFERELVPFSVQGQPITADQGLRETTAEGLAALRPAFKPDGKITAGNSSQISDGAAAVLVTTRDKASQLGLRPRARIVDWITVGVDPVTMLTGPIPASRTLLKRNRMTIDDVDLIEINEAFASVVAAWARELEPNMDDVNVNGGAIALGHPLGASGARLITSLLHEMERADKQIGLVTMCCGGGLGTATLIERL
jgi:acetyl-CoA acetyltransferase family protein